MTDKRQQPQAPDAAKNSPPPSNAKMVGKLLVVVLGMFGFGFALVPLYDVFCVD